MINKYAVISAKKCDSGKLKFTCEYIHAFGLVPNQTMVRSQDNFVLNSSNRLYESADESPAASELEVGRTSYAETVATSRSGEPPSSGSLAGTSERVTCPCVSVLLVKVNHGDPRFLQATLRMEARGEES